MNFRDLPSMPVATQSTERITTGDWRTIRPVLNKDLCDRCYQCWTFCPDVSVIVEEEGSFPKVDLNHCKGCGICSTECSKQAITMVREDL